MSDARLKHDIAKAVLRELWAERTGVLSTQVLQEFYVNATRKIRTPLPRLAARSVVSIYAPWCVEGTTTADITSAFEIEDAATIGFWDALILAVAVRSGAGRVLSEDRTLVRRSPASRFRTPLSAETSVENRGEARTCPPFD